MSSKPALVLNKVTRRFGKTRALNSLSLSVPERSVTAFVGVNGAGKTTTFSLVGGFIRPHGGSIEVFGLPLKKYRALGGIIGILPQDMQFFEERTIGRQLLLFAQLAGLDGKNARIETHRVLDLVKLFDRENEVAGELSHGMRVRLGVAQALIGNPPLVLLDEPTAGLDPRMIVEFRESIEAIRGKTTVVISSHNLSELQELCDHVCMIDHGALLMEGPMSQMLSGASRVVYVVDAIKRDLRDLEEQLPAADVVGEDAHTISVEFDLKRYKIADVNRVVLAWILNGGMDVIEVKPQRSLEQAFLSATGTDLGKKVAAAQLARPQSK
ncbi:MAG: ABC transporter ATP-binding protein [Deltaproteobacteria bacterium]|nr:ABC transporter ATP-binding protein [Deltaproteobacteria bacterium]